MHTWPTVAILSLSNIVSKDQKQHTDFTSKSIPATLYSAKQRDPTANCSLGTTKNNKIPNMSNEITLYIE